MHNILLAGRLLGDWFWVLGCGKKMDCCAEHDNMFALLDILGTMLVAITDEANYAS